MGLALSLAAILVPSFAAAQIIGKRPEARVATQARKPLSIREAVYTSVAKKTVSTYRQEEGSRTFLLEKSEGESSREWTLGGQVRPQPEKKPEAGAVLERRIKFLPHEGKIFVKIETKVTRGEDGAETLQFSGSYEALPTEGTWAAYEGGQGSVTLKLTPGDHQRYLEELRRAFHGPAALTTHAEGFRKELLGVLERKIADPGTTPPKEIATVRHLVETVKAHPEALAVAVTPTFEASPESFRLEAGGLSTTVEEQRTVLRFNATLPAPPPPGR